MEGGWGIEGKMLINVYFTQCVYVSTLHGTLICITYLLTYQLEKSIKNNFNKKFKLRKKENYKPNDSSNSNSKHKTHE
jgi:hypothetical protein